MLVRSEVCIGLTGIASAARDVQNGEGRGRKHPRSVGAEFVLTVGESRFQVQFDGRSGEVVPNSRVQVIGELGLVGGYEWGAFGLSDTRRDWRIVELVAASEDGVWLDLEPSGKVGPS